MTEINKKQLKIKKGISVKYTVTYQDISGEQHTSGMFDTIEEAENYLNNFDCSIETKITYGEIFGNFLARAKLKYASSTYNNYLQYYNRFFKKYDSIEYNKITSITWQNTFDEIEQNTTPYVVQMCLKFSKAAVNYSLKHGLVENNVFNRIEKIKLPKPDINHLTMDEQITVLNECQKSYPKFYVLLYTFLGTGAREGEILALTKDDFNYEEKTLTINKQFTKNKLVMKTKTTNSSRKIYLHDNLAEVLKEYIKTLDKENPLLFPNTAGNYYNANNIRRRFWYPLLVLCHIKKRVRLHDTRGTYIDMLLSNGISVKFAQNQAGHSRSETTLDVYAVNNEDMIKQAQNTINGIFKEKMQNKRK